MTDTKARIFVSYARSDGEAFAQDLRRKLVGIFGEEQIWRDRDEMEGGVGWWKQITSALETVEFMVLIATPAAMASPVVKKEWRYARQQGVCVYPVQVPGLPIDFAALPRWMRDAHFYNLDKEWETFINYLKAPCHAVRVPFYGVPDLPEHFVQRHAVFEQMKAQLLDEARDNPVAITTSLVGAGGFGKTTLAAALCHDEDVQTAFDDGVLWVTLGETPNLLGIVNGLYRALTGEKSISFESVHEAASNFTEKLEDNDILLVIDDIWDMAHVKPFLQGGKQCARLMTTRFINITVDANARPNAVDEMQISEAVQMLLAGIDPTPDNIAGFSKLAQRLGKWALMLEITNGMLREALEMGDDLFGAMAFVNEVLDEEGIYGIERDSKEERSKSAEGVLSASFRQLEANEQQQLLELAIFLDDSDIPLTSIGALWSMGLTRVRQQIQRYARLSFVKFDAKKQIIRIHDVVREVLETKLKAVTLLAEIHLKLIDGYNDLMQLPDNYGWRNIAYHLIEAQQRDRLHNLLTKTEDWLYAKLDALGIYESIVIDIDRCLNSYTHNSSIEIVATAELWAVRHIVHEIVASYNVHNLRAMVVLDKYVERDNKRIQKALSIARLKPDVKDRFACLFTIFKELGFSETNLYELEQIVRGIDEEPSRRSMWQKLRREAIPPYEHPPVRSLFPDQLDTPYQQYKIDRLHIRDCIDEGFSEVSIPSLKSLVVDLTDEEFHFETYDDEHEYLKEALSKHGLKIISRLIESNHIYYAIYLLQEDEYFNILAYNTEELFEIVELLAKQGCRESLSIYEKSSSYRKDNNVTHDKAMPLFEIIALLVNLKMFNQALQCTNFIQPDLFGNKNRILEFIESCRKFQTTLNKPDLETWYEFPQNHQAFILSQSGKFIGDEGAFKKMGLQPNLLIYLSNIALWNTGLEKIDEGLSLKAIQKIIQIMAWNDTFWLKVQEILLSQRS